MNILKFLLEILNIIIVASKNFKFGSWKKIEINVPGSSFLQTKASVIPTYAT